LNYRLGFVDIPQEPTKKKGQQKSSLPRTSSAENLDSIQVLQLFNMVIHQLLVETTTNTDEKKQ